MKTTLPPPIATQIRHVHEKHGDKRVDFYHWLSNKNDTAVIEYLEKENQYVENTMQHTQELQDLLYEEMQGRIVESEASAPIPYKNYEYFNRENRGQDYRIHYRRKRDGDGTEELLLDENALAENFSYFRLYSFEVSPNEQFLAYSFDTKGDEQCKIEFLDLKSGKLLPDSPDNVSGNIVWANDSETYFYTTLNSAHRPWRLYKRKLGDSPEDSELIFQEDDEAYYLWLGKTDSECFVTIKLQSNNTSEVHLLNASDPKSAPLLVFPRQYDVRYSVQDHGDDLYVLTNKDAVNFRLMKTRLHAPNQDNWETVIKHSSETTLTKIRVFKHFIAVGERTEGLPQVRILPIGSSRSFVVEKPQKIQELYIGANEEFDTTICRLNGNALDMPLSQYDCSMETGTSVLVKTRQVGGGYDASHYAAEKHFAVSEDGEKIPLYIVYNKKVDRNTPAPLLLNGYGSYGHAYPLHFSASRLSLLDRGVIYALAHIRGGSEKGKKWYHDGKLMNKKNTFVDFTACARYLIDNKITHPDKLAITGGSAGGLVVGSFLNNTPELCAAAVAHVPFVDVITTILNDSLPLSVIERDEWGDPNNKPFYDYIKSYSPYDNVKPGSYPALFVTAGLNDPRVGYWEPAKWTAKIRALKSDSNLLIFKTEMQSGHGGKSGRYQALQEQALEYAFLLSCLIPDFPSGRNF